MLRSIHKQFRESVESVLNKKKGYGGKNLQKGKVLSLEWKSEGVIRYKMLFLCALESRHESA